MRIHTDKLTAAHIRRATDVPGGQIYCDKLDEHGSRTHRRAFEVLLRGYGPRHTRSPNTGRYGGPADGERAATYDDWGWFLSALFDVDRSMKAGPYRSRADFHAKTDGAYHPHKRPADTVSA